MDPAPDPSPAERFTVQAGTYRRVAQVALALLCVIVVTGAAVRLTGSGLGCEDWPNCSSDDFIAVGNTNQAIEQLNRLFTGAVSLGVIAAVLGALRRRPYRRDLVVLSLGLVAGVVGQVVLGGITVLVELHPVAVGGHFVLSMVLVVTATALVWRAGRPEGPAELQVDRATATLSGWAMAAGAFVLAVTGPVLTGSGPHAGDVEARRFDIAVPDAARVHSLSAWLFLAVVVAVMVRLGRHDAPAEVMARARALLFAIIVQGGIGYLQYERGIPAALVLCHIAVATAITVLATRFHLGLRRVTAPAPRSGPVGIVAR
jgi:cytochrome c oxidase assembly protein subunit 15